jgi:hypothetical protein
MRPHDNFVHVNQGWVGRHISHRSYLKKRYLHQPAFPALDKLRRRAEPLLDAALAASTLASLQCALRYVPIVMPKEMHARYPARSKLRKKEQIYDCAQILDYDVFVGGDLGEQVRQYLRGIAGAGAQLMELGASREQIDDFDAILRAVAVDRVRAG